MGLEFDFIDAKTARLYEWKYDEEFQSKMIQLYHQESLDAIIISIKFDKNDCNLQEMNWMISLGYIDQIM